MKRTTFQVETPKLYAVRSLILTTFLIVGLHHSGNSQCQTGCSISCLPNVNVVLAQGTCEALILPSNVSAAISLACNDEYLVELRDSDGNIIPGNIVNASHVGQEVTFYLSNVVLGCKNFCSGKIIVENKNTPPVMTSTIQGMCGSGELVFPSLDEVRSRLNQLCTVPVSDLTEDISTLGDKCTGQMTIRRVHGTVNIDGIKKVLVAIDTAILMVLDTTMIECPGSAVFDEALEIDCSATDEYPSPQVIAKLFNDKLAYPWINKGKIETRRDTFQVIDSIVQTIVNTNINIDGVWVIFPVVNKDTVYMDSIVVDSTQVYIPIKNGATDCNITTKYADITYDGCTGEAAKILREWTILDWCTGQIKICQQWIVRTDNTAPWIDIPEPYIVVDVTPWTCKASLNLADYFTVKGGCTEVKYYLDVSEGVLDGTYLTNLMLTGKPVYVTIEARNGCLTTSVASIQILVADMSAPVAIATDQVQVTLTGDPYNTEIGVAKVYVDDIDAGSHDSGCGAVSTCILLDEELQDPLIVNGRHITDSDGNLLYNQHQCGDPDGIYVVRTYDKGVERIVARIPYVICKPHVKFCCDDIPGARVALVVSDDSPYSADGFSWSDVKVEDKSVPIIDCQDIEVDCGYSYHPDDIGYPKVYDPICRKAELSYIDDENVDACGQGSILRIWFYGDEAICAQRITFRIKDAFDPKLIKWPKHYNDDTELGVRRECEILKDADGNIIYDYTYDNKGNITDKTPRKGILEYSEYIQMGAAFECGVTEETGVPVWCNETCGLIVSSYEDVEVEAGEYCKKIIRKWTIIDWCSWQPNGSNIDSDNDTYKESFEAVNDAWLTDPDCKECEKESGVAEDIYMRYKESSLDNDGYYTYDQVIKILDLTPPAIDVVARDTVYISDGAQSKNEGFDDCVGSGTVSATVSDICGISEIINGDEITWSIITKNEYGDIIAGPKQVFGSSATMTTGVGMAGTFHEIVWRATDGCGNTAVLNTIVEFADAKNPTPVCIQDLSTSTMSTDGTVQIWASDFDRGSFDNCGSVKLAFLVDDNGDVSYDLESGRLLPSMSFDCDDLTAGLGTTINLEMYAIDDYGNVDFCAVRLRIDDVSDACPDGNLEAALIAGELINARGEMVEDATVMLNDEKEMITAVDGQYGFNNSALGQDYQIIPNKDGDDLNGVTVLDVYLIERHILGVGVFDSPYKMIAADINNDEKVSGLDLVALRRLILGIHSQYKNNTSWRFVDAQQEFDNILKPWPIKETIDIRDLSINRRSEDFVGVKIGDINGNAIPNSTVTARGRSDQAISLITRDMNIESGAEFEVQIKSGAAMSLVAYQLTLEHRDADLIEIRSNRMEITTENYVPISDDIITMSWSQPVETLDISENEILFTLVFRARHELKLSESISISDGITKALAYTKNLEALNIELSFLDEVEVFDLEQNHPNPFDDRTVIGFTLGSPGYATLTIFDATGRVLKIVEQQYGAGRNTIEIKKSDLSGSSPLIYYQLESNGQVATRKMLLME